MSDERVWLRHPETGGAFHCPVGAVDGWRELGWVDGEPPVEVNPAVADLVAAREAEAAARAAQESSRKRGTKSTEES
jgi:hypothetical protein